MVVSILEMATGRDRAELWLLLLHGESESRVAYTMRRKMQMR